MKDAGGGVHYGDRVTFAYRDPHATVVDPEHAEGTITGTVNDQTWTAAEIGGNADYLSVHVPEGDQVVRVDSRNVLVVECPHG